jgi:hypothetical protein
MLKINYIYIVYIVFFYLIKVILNKNIYIKIFFYINDHLLKKKFSQMNFLIYERYLKIIFNIKHIYKSY